MFKCRVEYKCIQRETGERRKNTDTQDSKVKLIAKGTGAVFFKGDCSRLV